MKLVLTSACRRYSLSVVTGAGVEHFVIEQHKDDPDHKRDNVQVDNGAVVQGALEGIAGAPNP